MSISFHDPVVANITTAISTNSTSTGVDLGGGTLVGVYVSTDTHKGTTISFQSAPTSSQTFTNVLTSTGNTVQITGVSTQAARYYALDPSNFLGTRFLKLVSGSTSETVTYTLAIRP